jgi:conjugative transfer signal peptidase TraF
MKRVLDKAAATIAIAGVSTIAIGMLCFAIGVRVNTSKSIPLGVYWTTSKPVEKGDYVLFCPPDTAVMAEARRRGYLAAGLCPGNYGFMMKKILAAGQDAVLIGRDGVTVNGVQLPYSTPLDSDSDDRPLPHFQPDHFTLKAAEVMLMSDVSSTSFDARYFGPVDRVQIRTAIKPVFIW